ncbi:putative bifunctional diguanylate cyclase/phosphodiesterase [Cellulomonas soli]
MRSHAGEVAYVVPVGSPGREWGLLALVGGIDVDSSRETYAHWAALLASAFDQHDLVRAVRQSEERHSLLASAVNEGLWEMDTATNEVIASERALALLGLEHTPAVARTQTWRRGIPPEDLDHLLDTLRRLAAGDLPLAEIEYRYRGPLDADQRWMLARAMPATIGADGRAARIFGSMSDISRRKQLEEELRRHAMYDSATGLPNRRTFLDRLRRSVTRAQDEAVPYAVVFLDLDRFKVVNDSLGHQTGDRLLRAVSERLATALRPSDLAARFGGDEFAVLLDGIGPDDVPTVTRRLIEALSRPFDVDGHALWVTASLGVASSAVGYTDPEDVLRDADTAMYHAKTHEPGSAAFFDAEMHQDAVQHLRLQAEVQLALEREEFEVYYQPIVELDDSPVTRFEALVRWNHPTRGLVLPGTFLPLMEETGLVVRLGQMVVDHTCRDLAQWRATYAGPVTVSVNLSDREFWHTGLAQHVNDCLDRHGVPAECLTLEITEGVIARRPGLADQLLRKFHDAGLQLHIDDFGTGHSSLQTLHRYPVDALKIDRSFVHGLADEQQSRELVRAIVAMGRALGLTVIAEGVETRAQAGDPAGDRLRERAGVPVRQGPSGRAGRRPAGLDARRVRPLGPAGAIRTREPLARLTVALVGQGAQVLSARTRRCSRWVRAT